MKNYVQKLNGLALLQIVENTNLAYVKPHQVVIKDKLYLFFNEHDYFYINNLTNKYPMTRFREMV